jgi:hypothetical protein
MKDADVKRAIASAEEALAKQEQGEPVAMVTGVYAGRFTYAPIKASVLLPVGMALYMSPQQRTWVGLTDEEAQWLYDNCRTPSNLIDMTEAKLRSKNT